MSDELKLNWVNSTGGPLAFMDLEWASKWKGVSGLSFGSNYLSDYERACNVSGYTSILSVDDGDALILGDEPAQTTAQVIDQKTILLVRWLWADREQSILEVLSSSDLAVNPRWKSTGSAIGLPSGRGVLFDSSATGRDCREGVCVEVTPGRFTVSSLEWRKDSALGLVLHRLCWNSF